MNSTYDVIIIGSGPSGLTACTYASRASLKTLIIAGEKWGGQLMLTTDVENFPGFSQGVQGPQLMEEMKKQATRFGAQWLDKNVTSVDFSSQPFKVITNEQEYTSKSVILATGAQTKWLGIPGEQELIGRGVSSCAPCDAAFFRDKRVYVVGGGDAAMEEALVLTKFASEVTLIHRRDAFRASKIMATRVLDNPKIKVFWDTQVKEFAGQPTLQTVTLQTSKERWSKDKDMMLERGQGEVVGGSDPSTANAQSVSSDVKGSDPATTENDSQITWQSKVDGVFVAIGHKPSTDLFKDHLELDDHGYLQNNLLTNFRFRHSERGSRPREESLKTENLPKSGDSSSTHELSQNDNSKPWLTEYPTQTSIPGIFAVGDGFDYRYRQAITAAGYGCMGAMDAEKWLEENGLAEAGGTTTW